MEKELVATSLRLNNITVGGHTREEHDKNVDGMLGALEEKPFALNDTKNISAVSKIKVLN